MSMLLANLSKSPSITRLVTLTRTTVPALSPSKLAIAQLLELFNKGAEGGYNTQARFDYLVWFFGDLAKVLILYPSSHACFLLPLAPPTSIQKVHADMRTGSGIRNIPHHPSVPLTFRSSDDFPPPYHVRLSRPSPRYRLSPQKHCPPPRRYTLFTATSRLSPPSHSTTTLLVASRGLE